MKDKKIKYKKIMKKGGYDNYAFLECDRCYNLTEVYFYKGDFLLSDKNESHFICLCHRED